MKNIFLSTILSLKSAYGEVRQEYDVKWIEFLNSLNCNPVILPYFGKSICRRKWLHGCHGVVLTGGNDLGVDSGSKIDKMRDEWEAEAIDCCLQYGIPILGVCRGMQGINQFYGGTVLRLGGHVRTNHKLIPNTASKVFESISNIEQVNSFHDYSVAKLGDGLIVSAHSEDGAIEAIEHPERPIFGHMWHPERSKFRQTEMLLARTVLDI